MKAMERMADNVMIVVSSMRKALMRWYKRICLNMKRDVEGWGAGKPAEQEADADQPGPPEA